MLYVGMQNATPYAYVGCPQLDSDVFQFDFKSFPMDIDAFMLDIDSPVFDSDKPPLNIGVLIFDSGSPLFDREGLGEKNKTLDVHLKALLI